MWSADLVLDDAWGEHDRRREIATKSADVMEIGRASRRT